MAQNRFYRTDYPEYLKEELGNRFSQQLDHRRKKSDPIVLARVYNYDQTNKTWSTVSAEFGDFNNTKTVTDTSGNTLVVPNGSQKPILTKSFDKTTGRLTAFATGPKDPQTGMAKPTKSESVPMIKNIKIDVGGRVGTTTRGELTIQARGKDALNTIIDTVTILGARIELAVRHKLGGQQNDIANTLTYSGRIYDYSFTYETDLDFTINIKTIGLADTLTQLSGFPTYTIDSNPKIKPKGAVKEYPSIKAKDSDGNGITEPVTNLLQLIDAIFTTDAENNPDRSAGDGIIISGLPQSRGMFDKPYALGQYRDYNGPKEYLNLEAIRALYMQVNEYLAETTDNNTLKKLNITWLPGNTLYEKAPGVRYDWLFSADPTKILIPNRLAGQQPTGFINQSSGKALNFATTARAAGGAGPAGNIGGIYIERQVIFDAAGAKFGDTRFAVAGTKSIEAFFESIFKEIKTQSGGVLDLALISDTEQALIIDDITDTASDIDQTNLYIVDRNYVKLEDKKPPILEFPFLPGINATNSGQQTTNPEQHHYKDFTSKSRGLSANVPKSLAAKAFIRDINFVAADSQTTDDAAAIDTTTITQAELSKKLNELGKLQQQLIESVGDTAAIDSLTPKVQQILADLNKMNAPNSATTDTTRKDLLLEKAEVKNFTTALTLSISSFGISGFKWGHALALDFIPNSAPSNTVFSINKITHAIALDTNAERAAGWETTIDCLARIRPTSELNNKISVQDLIPGGTKYATRSAPGKVNGKTKQNNNPEGSGNYTLGEKQTDG